MILRLLLIATVLAASLLSGCAANPMTGRSQLMLVSEKSAIAKSTQAYSAMIGGLDKKGKISQDAALNGRVRGITDRLITEAVRYRPDARDWSWGVKVIDDPKVVNAFCMPGGKMAIYTGLIQKLDPSDDEIAQVMGHEIAHALAGHGAEKMSVDMLSSIAVAAVTAAAAGRTQVDGQTLQNTANLASNVFVTLPNSREEEAEADKMGIEIAARAGYDPRAAVTLWQKMIKESGGASRLDFLSTHPASPKRIEALAALEAPMMEIYGKAKARRQPVRAWTSTSPNERVVGDSADAPPEGRGGDEQPLVFYSPVFEKFKNGSLELACKSECAASFMLKQGTLRELFDKKDWRLLALETIQVGYRFDLSYYYLGESAAGLGFADAAGKYFGEAAKLASTDDACAKGVFIQCKGIDVTEGATQALNGRGQ